ncbi:MAG TPA: hypothetical protein VGR90_04565 [Acidimicrobiales bacterium]|nr:hypothetical protein [Acidimicrobiales bacterium]
MSFYNRAAALMVRPFTNQIGSVEPLSVVSYGGLQIVTSVFTDGNLHQILAAPAAGKTNRLHNIVFVPNGAFTCMLQGGTTAGTYFGGAPRNAEPVFAYLGGQLVEEAIQAQAVGATVAWRVTLTYDVVTFPNMI